MAVAGSRAVVVYVHGLWLQGHEAVFLRRRLARALQADTASFVYRSVGRGLARNVAALGEFLAATAASADTLHLVAHSMGGCLVLELFRSAVALPPGRIVLLGSPVGGSVSARRLARVPGVGAGMLGATAREVLVPPRSPNWAGTRELGVIAGNRGVGLGRVLGRMDAPNDGTVRVSETRLAGATQHLTLRVSHSGMVFSSEVARQTAAFLRDGRFAE